MGDAECVPRWGLGQAISQDSPVQSHLGEHTHEARVSREEAVLLYKELLFFRSSREGHTEGPWYQHKYRTLLFKVEHIDCRIGAESSVGTAGCLAETADDYL